MIWLLEQDIFENLDELKSEIHSQAMSYAIGQCIPFTPEVSWSKYAEGNEPRFVYGSLQFVKRLSNIVNVFCNLDQLKCSYYYPILYKYLLNKEHCFLPYGELIERKEWIFDTFGDDDCVFIRPDSGWKNFHGGIRTIEYWDAAIKYSNVNIFDNDFVLIARPKNIIAEYRVIIGPTQDNEGQRVITLCRSHKDGKLNPEPEARCVWAKDIIKYVENILENISYEPDPFWVMDVAQTRDFKFHVLELNSMSCSGYYSCDLHKIVCSIKSYFENIY